jgi:hypothetical protein
MLEDMSDPVMDEEHADLRKKNLPVCWAGFDYSRRDQPAKGEEFQDSFTCLRLARRAFELAGRWPWLAFLSLR